MADWRSLRIVVLAFALRTDGVLHSPQSVNFPLLAVDIDDECGAGSGNSADGAHCALDAMQRRGQRITQQGEDISAEARSEEAARDIIRMFEHVGSADAPGGLLVRFVHDDMPKDVSVHRDLFGAIGFNAGSDWSYWRKDLALFKIGWSRLGIVVDADKMWSQVQSMYVTDANSEIRKACSRYFRTMHNRSLPFRPSHEFVQDFLGNPCIRRAADESGFRLGDTLEWPTSWTGNSNAACAAHDDRCKASSAGGCLPWEYWLKRGPWCNDEENPMFKKFSSCFKFKELEKVDGQDGRRYEFTVGDGCLACSSPYRCVLEDPPAGIGTASRIHYDGAVEEFQAFVGKDGRRWTEAFIFNQTEMGLTMNTIHQCPYFDAEFAELQAKYPELSQKAGCGNSSYQLVADKQCGFKRQDVAEWVMAQRSYYEAATADLFPHENELTMYVEPALDGHVNEQEALLLESIVGIVIQTGEVGEASAQLWRSARSLQKFLARHRHRAVPVCDVSFNSSWYWPSAREGMRAALSPGGLDGRNVFGNCSTA